MGKVIERLARVKPYKLPLKEGVMNFRENARVLERKLMNSKENSLEIRWRDDLSMVGNIVLTRETDGEFLRVNQVKEMIFLRGFTSNHKEEREKGNGESERDRIIPGGAAIVPGVAAIVPGGYALFLAVPRLYLEAGAVIVSGRLERLPGDNKAVAECIRSYR